MEPTIYTLGYSMVNLADLEKFVIAKDAIVVDVRLKPFSRWKPAWNLKALAAQLGERYVHAKALGNVNYRGTVDQIELVDPEVGAQFVADILAEKSVILLCMCADINECHRKVAAELIATATGAEVHHLTHRELYAAASGLPAITQPPLF